MRLDDTVTATVTARHAHPGETVEVAAKIVTIADLNRVRIEAEVDAYDSGRVALGAEVRITAEGFERASWLANVEEIPDSVVPRRIRPKGSREADRRPGRAGQDRTRRIDTPETPSACRDRNPRGRARMSGM